MGNSKIQYFLLLNFAMLCISTSGVFGSKLLMSPSLGIWSRSFVAVLILGFYCKLKGFDFNLQNGRSCVLIFISSVMMTLHWVFYFFALKYANVTISMLAIFTYPMITTLLEPFFFDVKFKIRSVLICILMLVGLNYLLPDFDISKGATKGLLFGLASAFFYSIRNIILKMEVNAYNGSVLMWYQSMIAVLILIPVYFFEQFSMEIVLHDLPYLLGLGLITTAIGHTIFLNSFEHFKISTASILSGMQPMYGIILAVIFVAEVITLRTFLGGAIIIACILFESLASVRDGKANK